MYSLNMNRKSDCLKIGLSLIVLGLVVIIWMKVDVTFGPQMIIRVEPFLRSAEPTIPPPHFINEVVKTAKPKTFLENSRARGVAVLIKDQNVTQKINSSNPKWIYVATRFFGSDKTHHYYYLQDGREPFENYQCPYSNCLVSRHPKDAIHADAILFHVRDLDIAYFPIRRTPKQKWILYTMEPPWLDFVDRDRFNGLFNWTMSYRSDSDIVVKYGLVAKASQGLDFDTSKERKTRFAAWYVSDCCSESRREEYVRELKKHIKVDVYGGCGNQTSKQQDELLPMYYFYLAFENSLCKDYVTEKFFNALNRNLIPVVFGGADYATLAPPNSYINALDFKTPKDLAEYMKNVTNNDTLYASYFHWKRDYRSYLHGWPCDLCAKLHLDSERTTIWTNLRKWWIEGAKCKTWTMEGLSDKLPAVLPCYGKTLYN